MNPTKSSSAKQEQKILFLQQKLFEQQQQLQLQQQQQQLMQAQFGPQITSTFSHFAPPPPPAPSTGTFLPVAVHSPQREEAFQELFNSVAASPLPKTPIFPTPPPIGFKQGKNIALMKQMFHTSEPAMEASSAAGLLAESLPNFEENIEYDNSDDNDDDAVEFQDENDEQKGFEQTIQLIKKGTIDKEIKIMTQNKGNGTIQVYDAPTFSCIQNLQPFLKHYLRKKAIAEAQTRKLNRTLNTLISMSSKKAKIKKM